MNKKQQRIASLLLTICLLLSAMPPVVTAATQSAAALPANSVVYDVDLLTNGTISKSMTLAAAQSTLNQLYSANTLNWTYAGSSGVADSDMKFMTNGLLLYTMDAQWVAFRIKAPGTGTYTLGMNHATHPSSGIVAAYVLPGDTLDIAAAMTPSNRAGTADFWKESQTGDSTFERGHQTFVGTWDFKAGEEYILVLEAYEPSVYYGTRCYMLINQLFLAPGDHTPQAEQAQQVTPVTAVDGAVKMLEGCYCGTTATVNGNNYLFEPVEGGVLLAFDMDNLERKYEADVPYVVVRGITTDSSGNIWMCGDNTSLYCFDPVTRTGEQTASFSAQDAAATSGFDLVYADGCLYFGTYPSGGIMKYTISTGEFTQLYEHDDVNYINGIVYKDGYIYAGGYGDKKNDGKSQCVLKVNAETGTLEGSVETTHLMPADHPGMFYDAGLAGDLLLMGNEKYQQNLVAVDTDTMQLVDLNAPSGIYYGITEEVDGKVYFVLNGNGLCSLDVATRELETNIIKTSRGIRCADRSIVQLDNEAYPGNSILLYAPVNGDPMIYNLTERKSAVLSDLVAGYGAATSIRTMINGAGDALYVGAYNTDKCISYNPITGALTAFQTGGQTDALCYYNGELYAGNYAQGAIVRVDLENAANNEILLELSGTSYDQTRIHTLTGGEGKIFAGTVPNSYGYGGCLAWVDVQTGETYVEQNVVKNQSINCLVYKDGYLYGTTSTYGGNVVGKKDGESAKLFVYNVAEKKKIAEFDLRNYMDSLTSDIEFISGIAEDPDVAGRFWGLVSETLFTFTYDKSTGALSVTEIASYSKTSYSIGGGRNWFPRPFCFDSAGNLYLSFGNYGGMRRINTKNTADNERLDMVAPMHYALGTDGNLYYLGNGNVMVYPLNVSQAQKDAAAVVDQKILAIGSTVTLDKAEAIAAARNAYAALSNESKAVVQHLNLLEEAEAMLLQLQIGDLPANIDVTHKPMLKALFETYNAMTARQKFYVKNYAALISASNEADAHKPFQVGTTAYTTIGAALTAAQKGDTILLTQDATVKDVILTKEVTLDLNGYTLMVDALTADIIPNAAGYVVDSSAGNNGLLVVKKENMILGSNNPDLPLYDAQNGGYRFFDYSLSLHSTSENVGKGCEKFWFKFQFRTDDTGAELDQDAYALVAAGDSGVEISTGLTWNKKTLPQVYFGKDGSTDAFSAAWATGATQSRWLYVTVRGIDWLNGGTLTVAPEVTVNNVQVTNGQITYVQKAEPNYGWSDGIPE